MKVLMVMQHINFFRSMDTVVRELDARGHETTVLHGTAMEGPTPRRKSETMVLGRGLKVAETEIPNIATGYRPAPEEWWQQRLMVGRQVINRAIYLRDDHPSNRSLEGIEKGLSPKNRKRVNSRLGRLALKRRSALTAWRWIEKASPPSEQLTSLLEEIQPDVVLVTPSVWPKGPIETSYIHAARKLGIPTVGFVSGWDNLTSKGTVHRLPHALIVWNEAMAAEARDLHDVPREVIKVTGAPYLDRLFELRPSASRAETCSRLGCSDDGPYVLYLCSSRTIISNETQTVTALAEALSRECVGRTPTIVVRPHPVSADTWEGYERPGVAVHPKRGNQAETSYQWQEYYDQLAAASCVVGLNTSAFLEAVVADRPCLTVASEEFYDQQGATGHFRHLLDGDFLEVSSHIDEVATRVARILDGADEKAESRRRFAESFLRPCGSETPSGSVVADAIEGVVAPRIGDERRGAHQHQERTDGDQETLPVAVQGRAAHEPSASGPFFTIAIPTKNRPDQLKNAIRSVLEQTYPDFEVVVCDNSDELQSAQTAAVVREFADPRIRYIRTNGRLSMADNWDRAIADARGRFVGILTDRSVYLRDALQVARTEIDATGAKLLMWANDLYGRDPSGTTYKRRNCTFKRFYHPSDAMIDYFLCGHPKFSPKVIPKLLAGVCERSVLDAIRASPVQRVCIPVSPDYTSGFLMLAHCDWVAIIDKSLYISCGTGNGSVFRRGGELADRFRADLNMEWRDMVDRMPSDACFSTATVLNDFMRVREMVPDRLGRFELDSAHYYLGCMSDYVKTSRHGVLRTEDFDALLLALEQEPIEVRETVQATKYFESAVNAKARPEIGDVPKVKSTAAAAPPRFATVFDAMAWDQANPRTQASNTYLDLTMRTDQVTTSEQEQKWKRGLKAKQKEAKAAATVKGAKAGIAIAPTIDSELESPQLRRARELSGARRAKKKEVDKRKKGKKKRKKKPLGTRFRRAGKRIRGQVRLRTRLRGLVSQNRA